MGGLFKAGSVKKREPMYGKIEDRIVVALDEPDLRVARKLLKALSPYVSTFKIGLGLATAVGAHRLISLVHSFGAKVIYDGKFHDTPDQVAIAVKEIARLGADMFTVHASGGYEMLGSAMANKGKSKMLVVTVLTSLSEVQARVIYGVSVDLPFDDKVIDFAHAAQHVGADGIICSPREVKMLNAERILKPMFKVVVTPGIRPDWAPGDDQKRVMTPREAIMAGATALVIGRPITRPPAEIGTPVNAVKKIIEEIETAS